MEMGMETETEMGMGMEISGDDGDEDEKEMRRLTSCVHCPATLANFSMGLRPADGLAGSGDISGVGRIF